MIGAKCSSKNTYNIHEGEIILYIVGILYIKMHFYIFEYEYVWFYILDQSVYINSKSYKCIYILQNNIYVSKSKIK